MKGSKNGNNAQKAVKTASPWYCENEDNRSIAYQVYTGSSSVPRNTRLVQGRVSGMSMQGIGTTGILFFKREVVATQYTMELLVGPIRWSTSRSFDEFKRFYDFIMNDAKLGSNIKRITCPFPSGYDGTTDVMILVERKECLDLLLQQVLNQLNVLYYGPLNDFIQFSERVSPYLTHIKKIQRVLRRSYATKKRNTFLFQHYSREMTNITYRLEDGLPVIDHSCGSKKYNVEGPRSCYGFIAKPDWNNPDSPPPSSGPPSPSVLWLDVCDDPTLSRICVASKETFDLPMELEDERLANGIFLSDIAEVRVGCQSFGFSQLHRGPSGGDVPPGTTCPASSRCLSIIGLERCLDLELGPTCEVPIDMLCDMIRLMSIKSLSHDEARARKKKWVRNCMYREGFVPFESPLDPTTVNESNMLKGLLTQGIPVDEEVASLIEGFRNQSRILRYDPASNSLLVRNIPNPNASPNNNSPNSTVVEERTLALEDVSEVRAGKFSKSIDCEEDSVCVSVIASESVLVLPLSSVDLRDNLIRHFQSFVRVHKRGPSQGDMPSHNESNAAKLSSQCPYCCPTTPVNGTIVLSRDTMDGFKLRLSQLYHRIEPLLSSLLLSSSQNGYGVPMVGTSSTNNNLLSSVGSGGDNLLLNGKNSLGPLSSSYTSNNGSLVTGRLKRSSFSLSGVRGSRVSDVNRDSFSKLSFSGSNNNNNNSNNSNNNTNNNSNNNTSYNSNYSSNHSYHSNYSNNSSHSGGGLSRDNSYNGNNNNNNNNNVNNSNNNINNNNDTSESESRSRSKSGFKSAFSDSAFSPHDATRNNMAVLLPKSVSFHSSYDSPNLSPNSSPNSTVHTNSNGHNINNPLFTRRTNHSVTDLRRQSRNSFHGTTSGTMGGTGSQDRSASMGGTTSSSGGTSPPWRHSENPAWNKRSPDTKDKL